MLRLYDIRIMQGYHFGANSFAGSNDIRTDPRKEFRLRSIAMFPHRRRPTSYGNIAFRLVTTDHFRPDVEIPSSPDVLYEISLYVAINLNYS